MSKTLAVYTVALGGDFILSPIPPQDGVDFICFTDSDTIEPNGWEIRRVTPIVPSDTYRSARDMKIRAHRWLPDYDASLYIDSTVALKEDPWNLLAHLLPRDDVLFGGFLHSYRDSVGDEFKAVMEGGLDYRHKLDEHLEAFQTYHPGILRKKPIWGGILARRHNDPACVDAMEMWFAHVLRYARRDQLSLPLALSSLPKERIHLSSSDIRSTEFHTWPIAGSSRPKGYRVDETTDPPAWLQSITAPHRKENEILKVHRKFRRSLQKRGLLPSQWLGLSAGGDTAVPAAARHVSFGHDADLGLHYAEDKTSGQRVFVSHQKRLELYTKGIGHRQSWILKDYRLPFELISSSDVVIDVGANIGELGLWVTARGGRYIAFEPDPGAYKAMQNNVPDGSLHDVALSDAEGTATFYLNTAEADSSLFKPQETSESITVRTATLDRYLSEIGAPDRIRLLKVEAEGMEPEVLNGARETLARVEYVAVDAGPERGGDNTVPGVVNILTNAGFEVQDCFLLRGTFLFRRRAK